jgi:hypothetical protein
MLSSSSFGLLAPYLPLLQRLTLLDRLLLSMLVLSHVLFVCIPIVFLSQ